MITNSLTLDKKSLEIARKQFCLDIGLPWEEYVANRQKPIFIKKAVYAQDTLEIASVGARNYAGKTSFFRAIICLGQLFICCDESIYDWVVEQYGSTSPEWFCAFGNLRKLDAKLQEYGQRICDTHVYFLPEAENGESKGFEKGSEELVWFEQEEILRFKENNRFTSAICFWEGTPDVLAVIQPKEEFVSADNAGEDATISQGAEDAKGCKDFDQSHMAGMAGCSADGAYLWQVGINVDEEYVGRGLANKLVRALKEELLRRGKVPFYGTSESHTISQTVGLKAGFVPAWTEVFVEKVSQ